MQTTIYYRSEDAYLIDKLEEVASRERKSKSALILSILEEHFEAEKMLGEILRDLGVISTARVNRVLQMQEEAEEDKMFGEILLDENYVREVDLDRALNIQNKVETKSQ